MEELSELNGKTIASINRSDDKLVFIMEDGTRYMMYHQQSCCENVSIEDIVGDLDDLIGVPILRASEDTNSSNHPIDKQMDWQPESFTWTFYNFATIKGYVTIRWLGTSNGYYSEGVSFEKMR